MKVTPDGFPPDLLTQPPAARLAYFRGLTIGHPALANAYCELRCALRDAAPGALIFVAGPAGVGKTTLLQRVARELTAALLPELAHDPARLPVVLLEAVAPEAGSFNWKDYFHRLLVALAEPLPEHKLLVAPASHATQSQTPRPTGAHAASAKLRWAAEQALHHRRPLAVLVDDAQHLATLSSGRKLLDQLNTLKSVANLTRTTHVLAGTYELLAFRNLSGQLSRRSWDVPLERYRATQEQERQAFINTLWTFQQHLPVTSAPDLVQEWDFYYERSIGCIGILKDWLTQALAVALHNGREIMTRRDLESRALSVAQAARMLTEALEGERQLTVSADMPGQLRQRLGLAVVSPEGAELPLPTEKPAGRRIGQRRPVRDPVGLNTI
jgi:hypothetical protein